MLIHLCKTMTLNLNEFTLLNSRFTYAYLEVRSQGAAEGFAVVSAADSRDGPLDFGGFDFIGGAQALTKAVAVTNTTTTKQGLQVGTLRGSTVTTSNGLVSKTTAQAADALTRSGYKWLDGSDGVVDGITNLSFAFKSNASGTDPAGFSRFTAAEINYTLNMMASWSDVANIKFNRVGAGTTGDGAYSNNATILFSNYNVNDGNAAYAYMPGATDFASNAGDVYVNFNNPSSQIWDYMTYDLWRSRMNLVTPWACSIPATIIRPWA